MERELTMKNQDAESGQFFRTHTVAAVGRRPGSVRGFTIIELIVVILVIGLFAAMTVPAFRSMTESSTLTSAAGMLADQLNLARQTAITRNLPVEFRIYQVGTGPNAPYRMIGSAIVGSGQGGTEWVTLPKPLPGSIIIDTANNHEFSSLLRPGAGNQAPFARPAETGAGVPAAVRNRPYIAFTFRPDGSTDLNPDPPNPWTFSVRAERSMPVGDRPAYNFVTLLLDPVLGRVRSFRP